MKKGKIALSGALGFVGSKLSHALEKNNFYVRKLTRNKKKQNKDFFECDYYSPQSWKKAIDGMDIVIHLAGENISSGRWSNKKKKRLYSSRIDTTKAMVEAISQMDKKPQQVLISSAVGIYGDRGDEILTEESKPGKGFLSELGEAWEKSSEPLNQLNVRRTIMRFGVVLGKNGGFIEKLKGLMNMGLGGAPGNGKQYMPWIADIDLINAILFLMKENNSSQIYNLTAPNVISANELFRTWGKVINRPVFLNAPSFALRLAFGDMADEMLLASTRVLPKGLENSGFKFSYPEIKSALGYIFK